MRCRPFPVRRNMKKRNQRRLLSCLLAVLLAALVLVVGYMLLREYQYGVSEQYYDSLRVTSLVQGGRWEC